MMFSILQESKDTMCPKRERFGLEPSSSYSFGSPEGKRVKWIQGMTISALCPLISVTQYHEHVTRWLPRDNQRNREQ